MEKTSKKCLVIYNPMSGKGMSAKMIEDYKKIFQEKGYVAEFVATKHSNHATEIVASAEHYDIVFSIGGDGTLNEVVKGNYLREDKLTICPLPSGTCNDVATMLGYGNDSIANLVLALEGEVTDIDIGTVNDDPFAYVVGMGVLMDIPYETSSEEKRKMGYLAYLKAGIGAVLTKMKRYRAEVTIDGMNLDGQYSLIMISNSSRIAGFNDFHKGVSLNDGKLEVLLCKAKNKVDFIKNFILYLAGAPAEAIKSIKAHNITVKLLEHPEKEWCMDGERYPNAGNTYNITTANRMRFLTPKEKVKKLLTPKALQN